MKYSGCIRATSLAQQNTPTLITKNGVRKTSVTKYKHEKKKLLNSLHVIEKVQEVEEQTGLMATSDWRASSKVHTFIYTPPRKVSMGGFSLAS